MAFGEPRTSIASSSSSRDGRNCMSYEIPITRSIEHKTLTESTRTKVLFCIYLDGVRTVRCVCVFIVLIATKINYTLAIRCNFVMVCYVKHVRVRARHQKYSQQRSQKHI